MRNWLTAAVAAMLATCLGGSAAVRGQAAGTLNTAPGPIAGKGTVSLPTPVPMLNTATGPSENWAGLTNAKMKFDFQAAPVDAILVRMSQEYGLIIVQPQRLQQKVTILNPQPLDWKSGVILLNDMLYQIGYSSVVNMTPEGHIVLRIVTVTSAHHQIPVYSGANPDEIPLNDSLRMQIIPLKHVPAAPLRQDLLPFLSTDADVTVNAASNSLIVTDTSAKIHRLAEIIQKLDVPKNSGEKASATQSAGH